VGAFRSVELRKISALVGLLAGWLSETVHWLVSCAAMVAGAHVSDETCSVPEEAGRGNGKVVLPVFPRRVALTVAAPSALRAPDVAEKGFAEKAALSEPAAIVLFARRLDAALLSSRVLVCPCPFTRVTRLIDVVFDTPL
jgi:hypothetical protein